jgi:phosphatidylglycerophosphate synthase
MFDEQMRRAKDSAITPLARLFERQPPWLFSLLGLAMGIATAVALWRQAYLLGIIFWFFNRLFDGLDGVIARRQGSQSDFGGYLDILLDFVTYAIIPIGLVLGRTSMAVYLALIFLLSSFYVNAASWMYLAAVLEKRANQRADRLTSVTMPAGIIGGVETIIFYTAFILFPGYLVWLFGAMTALVGVTILQRLIWAARHLPPGAR